MILLSISLFMYVVLAVHEHVRAHNGIPNSFIGYRTKRSLKNKESWFAAQSFVHQLGKKIYCYTSLIGIAFTTYDTYHLNTTSPMLISLLLQVMVYLCTIFILFYKTEHFLEDKF